MCVRPYVCARECVRACVRLCLCFCVVVWLRVCVRETLVRSFQWAVETAKADPQLLIGYQLEVEYLVGQYPLEYPSSTP